MVFEFLSKWASYILAKTFSKKWANMEKTSTWQSSCPAIVRFSDALRRISG